MVIEAKSDGEPLISTAVRFIKKNGNILNEQELTLTIVIIAELKDALDSGDKDRILKKADELNEYTRPFAERLMDMAVGQAMKGKSIEEQ